MRHEHHDKISLAIARRIAASLPKRPDWIEAARQNLDRWMTRNRGAPRLVQVYREWLAILDRPIAEVCTILTAETDEGQRLRQSSPFVGVLPKAEEREIEWSVHHDERAA